jgi:hypothetical protein
VINCNNLNTRLLIANEDKHTSICIKLLDNDGKYSILPKDNTMPTLFADFPLIGSESIEIPFYINSHIFWPNEERSSIIL